MCLTILLIFFFVFCRTAFLIEDNEWRAKFQRVLNLGLERINLIEISTTILFPIIIWLLDFLLIPFFIARCLCYFTDSYTLQSVIVRYSFHVYQTLRIGYAAVCVFHWKLASLYNEIRDTRYLIGTELTNR